MGDLLYFPGHIAMYIGDGKYIHSTGKAGSGGVVINSLNPVSYTHLDVYKRQGQYAPFGVSNLKYKGQHLQDHYISMEEFEANKEKAGQ